MEDDQGTVNFTEDLGMSLKKYRKKAKIVGEEELPPPEANGGGETCGKGKGRSGPAPKRRTGSKTGCLWREGCANLEVGIQHHGRDVKAAEKQLVEIETG